MSWLRQSGSSAGRRTQARRKLRRVCEEAALRTACATASHLGGTDERCAAARLARRGSNRTAVRLAIVIIVDVVEARFARLVLDSASGCGLGRFGLVAAPLAATAAAPLAERFGAGGEQQECEDGEDGLHDHVVNGRCWLVLGQRQTLVRRGSNRLHLVVLPCSTAVLVSGYHLYKFPVPW